MKDKQLLIERHSKQSEREARDLRSHLVAEHRVAEETGRAFGRARREGHGL